MASSFPQFLEELNFLPGIQVYVVLTNGALANNGTGGVPYVLTGSLVAETDERFNYPLLHSHSNSTDGNEQRFLLIDLGSTGITILVPGNPGTPLTITGIIAININHIQFIAPVTPI